jgi:transcriptional regulator with XRE-family HTH domain
LSTFGDRFKKLRLSRDLTQEQLAEEFNEKYNYSFTKATISQYENNKRTPEMSAIMNLVDYFKTSLDYLLCNDSYILKEMSGAYCSDDNLNCIDLENTLAMINNMALSGKIKVNDKKLNEAQTQVLNNCLEIAVELVKRNALNKE